MEATGPSPRDIRLFERYLRRPRRRTLARVVRQFHAHVWRVALRVTGHPDDASDVTQDVFLSLLKSPPAPTNVRSPRGYLTSRVLTLARRSRESAERRRRREREAVRRLSGEQGLSPEDVAELYAAIAALPRRLREIVELRYLAGYRNREVADLVGLSERSVEADLKHARDLLRVRLGGAAFGALALIAASAPKVEAVPPGLLPDLLRVVRLGDAVLPASVSRSLIAGGFLMAKKTVATVAGLIIAFLTAWGLWTAGDDPLPFEETRGGGEPLALRASSTGVPRAAPRVSSAAGETAARSEEQDEDEDDADVEDLSGWAFAEDGIAVEGARVRAFAGPRFLTNRSRYDIRLVGETTTDAAGRFRIPGARKPSSGEFSLVAEKPGYAMGWAKPRSGLPSPSEAIVIVLSSDTATISGHVVDPDGRPVVAATARAAVHPNGFGIPSSKQTVGEGVATAVTDDEGRFSIEDLPARAITGLHVSHPAYLPRTFRHVVPGGPPGTYVVEPGLRFEGRVVASEGEPVPGVAVVIQEAMDERFFGLTYGTVAESAEDGSFRCQVPPGTYEVSVDPPLRYTKPPPYPVEVRDHVTDHVIALGAECFIEGTVEETESGTKVRGEGSRSLRVRIHSGGVHRRISLEDDGSFRSAVAAGEVQVVLERFRGSYRPGEPWRGVARPGETVRCTLQCSRNPDPDDSVLRVSITGRVVDGDGNPLVALVALEREERRGFHETSLEAQTGLNGRFRFSWPAARFPVFLAAAAPYRGLFAELPVEPTGEDIELRVVLEPCGRTSLEGFVRSSTGRPVPHAGVVLSRYSRSMFMGVSAVRADEGGRFTVKDLLPHTRYSLTPVAESIYGPRTTVHLGAGVLGDVEVVFPERDGVLAGVVADPDGRPLPDLRIAYDYEDDELPVEQWTTTDGAGTFRIAGILPGKYHLIIDNPGHSLVREHVTVAPSGAGDPLRFRLSPTRRVRFRLEEPNGAPRMSAHIGGEDDEFRWPSRGVSSADGTYDIEVPVTETALFIARSWKPRPADEPFGLRLPLAGPPEGDLDLGTVVLDEEEGDDSRR